MCLSGMRAIPPIGRQGNDYYGGHINDWTFHARIDISYGSLIASYKVTVTTPIEKKRRKKKKKKKKKKK